MSASLNTIVYLRIKISTPVHIGCGKVWKRGIDFIVENKKVNILDQEELVNRLTLEPARGGKNGVDEYIQMFSAGQTRRIEKLLDRFQIDMDNKIAPVKVAYKDEPVDEIRPLTRTGQGTPILPGSSLKGALRSALFHHLWNREGKNARDERVDNRLLGAFERAITRYIGLSDVEISQTEITNIVLFNLQKIGVDWKSYYGSSSKGDQSDLLLSAETFAAGAEGQLRLSLADGWLKMIEEVADSPRYREEAEGIVRTNTKFIIRQENPVQHLFKLVNEYTREHLRREIAFFEAFPQAEQADFIIHNLRELKQKTENNARSCILRVGYGSGYHGITGDYWVDDHVEVVEKPVPLKIFREEKDYRLKSRRIAKGAALTASCMGFVEIFLPGSEPDIPFQPVLPVDEPKRQAPPGTKAPAQAVQAKPPVPYAKIEPKTVFQAEVLEVGKPFSKVRLLIEDYPFEPFAMLSGTKKVNLQAGMIVEVVVNSRSQSGEIKQVTYWHP